MAYFGPPSVVIVTDYTTVYPTQSVVVITDYTTVYPTDIPQLTSAPSSSLPSAPASTTINSSHTRIQSIMSKGTVSATSIVSHMIPTESSATDSQPISSDHPEAPDDDTFDDIFAYVILGVVVMAAVVLIAMLLYMAYLRWKGKCPNCHEMQKQIAKWESGELKRITPELVKTREALNRSVSRAKAHVERDLERGEVDESKPAYTAFWRNAKGKALPDDGSFALVKKTKGHSDFDDSRNNQSFEMQRIDGGERRVFADVSVSEPKYYPPYVTGEDGLNYNHVREHEIRAAKTTLESDEYRRAEAITKRTSAADSKTRRATSIVNLADQQLNITRHPSMYPEFRFPEETEDVNTGTQYYQMMDWHRKGNRAPESDDELYCNP